MEGIVAIDPAGMIFEENNAHKKLGQGDAKAVQAGNSIAFFRNKKVRQY